MKNWVLYFLAIAFIVIAIPFAAKNSVATDGEIAVSVCFSDGSIHEIAIEDYVLRALAARERDVVSLEAKKAFAVAVRSCGMYFATFGCKHLDFDACADSDCCIGLADAEEASEATKNAVRETEGLYLTVDGSPAMSLFTVCASSGTRQNSEFPYLVPVASGGQCEAHKAEKTFTAKELFSIFPYAEGSDSFYPVYGDNKKVEFAIFGSKSIDGDTLARSFGIQSVEFTATPNGDGMDITVYGIGQGYGLDLCNAEKLAKNGLYYQKILEIYFPKLKIKQA